MYSIHFHKYTLEIRYKFHIFYQLNDANKFAMQCNELI